MLFPGDFQVNDIPENNLIRNRGEK